MMAKAQVKVIRHPPRRTLTKQQAVRHLIHAAGRMIAAGEDPFAIHILIQSADKLLIDLGKKAGRDLKFTWGELVRPEYKAAVIQAIRETSNYFKHADKDHDAKLHVGEIAYSNLLQIGLCIVNYLAIYGEWTDHMQLILHFARITFPNGFVTPEDRAQFDTMLPGRDLTLGEHLSGWWDNPLISTVLPNLEMERAEDLQDTQPLYGTRISDLHKTA